MEFTLDPPHTFFNTHHDIHHNLKPCAAGRSCRLRGDCASHAYTKPHHRQPHVQGCCAGGHLYLDSEALLGTFWNHQLLLVRVRIHISSALTSYRDELLASSVPVDLVFICSADQYHADQAIACANAGKHVMLEKPMVQTLSEADALEEARKRNNVVIFVGYMRRYATAFKRFKDAINGKDIKYVRVRDIIGGVSAIQNSGATTKGQN